MEQPKFIIKFCADGEPISDFAAEEQARALKKYEGKLEQDFFIKTSSALFITAIRTLIAEGELDKNLYVFQFNDERINIVGDYFDLESWPKGFCDHEQQLLRRIIKKKRDISIQKREQNQ